jgi:hypothetical protein
MTRLKIDAAKFCLYEQDYLKIDFMGLSLFDARCTADEMIYMIWQTAAFVTQANPRNSMKNP